MFPQVTRCYNRVFPIAFPILEQPPWNVPPPTWKPSSRRLFILPPQQSPLLAWPVVCGSAVAERTRALIFSAGILRVEVADTGWRQELSSLAPRYLAAINRYSAVQVSRIQFVVKP